MPQPLISYLKWRVLDPISGGVLIDPLPHPHQSTFKHFIAQGGTAGNSVNGSFDIPLWGPGTDQYRWAKPLYDQLALSYMQRVEAYMSTSPVDAAGVAGDPVFSGVITKLPQDLNSFTISGQGTLYLAQVARTGRMENFTGRTDQLFTYGMKVYGLVFADDFTETLLNNYTNTGPWSLTTDQGYNAITNANSLCTLTTNASFANANYADCAITADFHMTGPNGPYPSGHSASIVAAGTIKGNVIVTNLSATQSRLDVSIWDTGVQKAYVEGVLTSANSSSDWHVQARLIGVQSGSSYTWRLLVNGSDPNCVYTYTATPSGTIGLTAGTIVASDKVWVHGAPGAAFIFENKVSVFQPGQVITGLQSINQVLSLQPPIDLFNLAMSTEGAQYRKNPKAGLNNDVLDFYSPVGTDLSKTVRFEEGVNLSAIKVEPNAEPINTALIAASSPGPDHMGVHWRYNLPAIRKHGMVIDTGHLAGPVDSWAVRRQADTILLNRATPQQAKTLTVLRDSNHAIGTMLNSTTGLIYREGDFITLHVPRLGIYNQKSQIVGFTFKEGEPSMEIVLDQYPRHLDRIIQIDRLKRIIDHLMSNAEDVTSFQNGLILDRRVVVPINPFKAHAFSNVANQAILAATLTKVSLQATEYDTSNAFDPTTNFRFTAPVAGYYWVAGSVSFAGVNAANQRYLVTIYKNGAEYIYARGGYFTSVTAAGITNNVASSPVVVYLNATNYVELYAYATSAQNISVNTTSDVSSLFVHLYSL